MRINLKLLRKNFPKVFEELKRFMLTVNMAEYYPQYDAFYKRTTFDGKDCYEKITEYDYKTFCDSLGIFICELKYPEGWNFTIQQRDSTIIHADPSMAEKCPTRSVAYAYGVRAAFGIINAMISTESQLKKSANKAIQKKKGEDQEEDN